MLDLVIKLLAVEIGKYIDVGRHQIYSYQLCRACQSPESQFLHLQNLYIGATNLETSLSVSSKIEEISFCDSSSHNSYILHTS